MRAPRCAWDAVVMMRAGALSFSRWRRSLLSRNGARWLTAQVSSMPSFVSCRVPYIAPALRTTTCSFGYRANTAAANLRTEACDERSAMNVATVASLLAAALMRADAMRVLVLRRPTMARFAPSAASASAAAKPMPLVAPVIRICLSFTAQQSKALATREMLAATRALVSSDISSRRRHDRAPMWQRGLHQFVPTQQVRRGCQGAIVATMDWLYPLSGFVVGAIVGLTGMGGGSLMTPLLILLFGVHPLTAVGNGFGFARVA